MWARNKTGDWLKSKNSTEQQHLINLARTSSEVMKGKYKSRRSELKEKNEMRLLERQNEKKVAEKKRNKLKADCVNDLMQNKLTAWLSVEEANEKVKSIDPSMQMRAIQIQLDFYKHVIYGERKAPQHWFSKSKNNVKLTFDELFKKLVSVIENSMDLDNDQPVKKALKSADERVALYNTQKEKLGNHVIDCRLGYAIENKIKKQIPKILANPQLLVGCRIQHRIKETKDDDEIWCAGYVSHIDKFNNDNRKVVYSVIYDTDPETYAFPLILDMERKKLFCFKCFMVAAHFLISKEVANFPKKISLVLCSYLIHLSDRRIKFCLPVIQSFQSG